VKNTSVADFIAAQNWPAHVKREARQLHDRLMELNMNPMTPDQWRRWARTRSLRVKKDS